MLEGYSPVATIMRLSSCGPRMSYFSLWYWICKFPSYNQAKESRQLVGEIGHTKEIMRLPRQISMFKTELWLVRTIIQIQLGKTGCSSSQIQNEVLFLHYKKTVTKCILPFIQCPKDSIGMQCSKIMKKLLTFFETFHSATEMFE